MTEGDTSGPRHHVRRRFCQYCGRETDMDGVPILSTRSAWGVSSANAPITSRNPRRYRCSVCKNVIEVVLGTG